MEKLREKYAEIFGREHDFLEEAKRIIDNPPKSVDGMRAHLLRFYKGYNKLLSQSEKLTRLADNTQNKLMRLKMELERQNEFISEQHEQLVIANRKLEEASITDLLTGLRNRRFLDSFLEKDVENIMRAYGSGPPSTPRNLFFLMIDLDRFKNINDTHGHNAGDMALQQFGRLVMDNCRKGDISVRWGGEEFLLVCRDADRQYGAALAERLRAQVAATHFQVGNGKILRLTCSIGFAFYPFFSELPNRLSWLQVVDLADRGLYAAKNHGRNAWVGMISDGRVPEGMPEPSDRSFLGFLHREGCLETLTSLSHMEELALY